MTAENVTSVDGQHALQDMVELQMYLLFKSQRAPWHMLPRRARKLDGAKRPYGGLVESSAARELIDRGFIERSSSRTFVVSKSGYLFYEREMKPNLSLIA